MRAVRIGVTGKLGSGKSVLLRLMAEHSSPTMRFATLRTDDLARELTNAYSDDKLNRAFVASRIFQDKSLLASVEAAVHPVVTREVEKVFREKPSGVVAVESALILKTRFREIFDYIVLVESPQEASVERVIKEGRLTGSEAEARLSEQEISREEHDEADFFIENNGSAEEFEEKCRKLLALLEPLCMLDLPESPLHADSEFS
jgi:dephospho-CoA kinase